MTSTANYATSGTRGSREFLQRRVSMFGWTAAAIVAGVFVLRMSFELAIGNTGVFGQASALLHLAAALSFAAVGFICGQFKLTYRDVRAVEMAGILVGSALLIGMGAMIPHLHSPHAVVTLALTHGFVARSVYVPSSATRTLTLCLATGAALVATILWKYDIDGAVEPLVTTIGWLATTAVCVAASRVIYGLRKQVDAAEQLGQYTLEEKLGEGAMGVVYRARHAMLARPTAVKLLMPDRLGETALARFEREVQLTAQLTHPNTVTIFDYGRTPEGIFYYAMELLEGAALDRIVEVGGPQPAERVAYLMDQVAAALSEAHGRGLIHRDIKPANIILTEQGGEPDVAKVVDFGLVKDVRDADDPNLSSVGGVAGTPYYMSPETILAYQTVDHRTDIYALGAVAYFLLTGEPVFKGKNAGEICSAHVSQKPVPPSKRRSDPMPPNFEAIVLACLAKDPNHRPATAGHLRARLWAEGSLRKWNTDLARRWWRKHGEEVKKHSTVPEAAGHTIAVDLEHHKR